MEPTLEEVKIVLQEVYDRTNIDFRSYSPEMIKRRITRRLQLDRYENTHFLLSDMVHNSSILHKLVSDFCIHVTHLFRDPEMYRVFRKEVIPFLIAYSHIRIWVAGCATGEEVFSTAMLLQEEGVLHKSRIYATDIRNSVLQVARKGMISEQNLEKYILNYRQSGGHREWQDFGEFSKGFYYLHPSIMDKITFSQHNLEMDGTFHEFVLCRNVMIYFNQDLKHKVHNLLYQSLKRGGFLILGDKESIRFTGQDSNYIRVSNEKIYRKL
jgi:chemotaxis protein methyltransferase CheR